MTRPIVPPPNMPLASKRLKQHWRKTRSGAKDYWPSKRKRKTHAAMLKMPFRLILMWRRGAANCRI